MDKPTFIELFKKKTKTFAKDIILFCDLLPQKQSNWIISKQLIRSASSTGANYRAACKARSKAEFYSKISIVVEESDECLYWIELLQDIKVEINLIELERLKQEAIAISKVVTTARKSTKR